MRASHNVRLLMTRRVAGALALALAGALTLCPAPASAASTWAQPPKLVYAVTFSTNSALYRLSPRSHRAALAGRTGVTLTDISFRGSVLYAVSFTTLYRLNATTGARHQVGPLGLGGANALATQPGTNILYGADTQGTLFTINARTGHATVVGAFGHGLGSSGDLAFAGGRLYATVVRPHSDESILAAVNVRTGAATTIGRTGYRKVWGLIAGTRSLYGATYGGDFLAISTRTGRARLIWKDGLAIGGLAAPSSCPWTSQTIC